MFYVLDENQKPVLEPDSVKAMKFVRDNKIVAQTTVNGYLVSTVFLGVDHSFCTGDLDYSEPVLWETMVFKEGEWSELLQRRYSSYKSAREGHAMTLIHVVDWIRGGEKGDLV